ncbi:hypothetical protein FKP32DRAFT_806572 [Trametes sanguinea]|nr:hypothetical protein FKP32DRAFT_806572 [Trametes sanguinea]
MLLSVNVPVGEDAANDRAANDRKEPLHLSILSDRFDCLLKPAANVVKGSAGRAWRAALLDSNTLVSIRDVKQSSVNYKAKNPRNHDFSRHVLPVSESEIKEQQRLRVINVNESVSPASSVQSSDTTLAPTSPSPSDGDSKSSVDVAGELSSDEQFMRKLLDEFHTVNAFKSNPGIPKGDLQGLDGDAFDQLESRLSIDDQDTPDSWIARSPELRRLTGKHPLNAEPDLLRLYNAGMVTPTKLHFVRNHGAVPQLHWETHTVLMYADPPELMTKPREWTMDELTSGGFKIVEFPVTIGCDGNRRREVNMVKRTVGFNWTASGVSTAVWRGVPLRDVLLACGLKETPDDEIWYVNFEGADEPSMGRYATSIPLVHAMDPANDVILAFGMNGRVLHPDHGYPMRVVIPGYVGGRQIKWLKRIWATKEPNQSFYHIWDNKVVPSFIDSKSHPLAKVYFSDESTACWEQIMQSIICKPAHDETIDISDDAALQKTYTIQGFAYNGGGNRIERVELSLDGGKTWRWCFRHFLDAPMRHRSKFWAWLFWSCEVKLRELANAFEIIVRAQDHRKMYQPEHITWSLTGMMNNSWYRVRLKITLDPPSGARVIHFQHPVAPLDEDGGWMTSSEPAVFRSDERIATLPTFSLEEIAKHNKLDDAWIILDNKVYDVTSVFSWHPGGPRAMLLYAGKASIAPSIEYKNIHDNFAHGKRDECLIGTLTPEGIAAMERDAKRAAKELEVLKATRKGLALQPDVFIAAKLVRRKNVSADSRLYTFELPRHADGSLGKLGLPVGQHIQISLHFKDQAVLRSYTPVRPVLQTEEDGTVDLLVKTYLPNVTGNAAFPGGTISNYLDCMEEGEEIDIRGPCGGIVYHGHGEFEIDGTRCHFDKINLIAGGSGLTPHWQLIHAILSDPRDATTISLIDCNKTVGDIWMREALESYAAEYQTRFRLWHVLTSPPEDWQYSCGRLDKSIIDTHLYPCAPGVGTFLCGPAGLVEDVALPALEQIGFVKESSIFEF